MSKKENEINRNMFDKIVQNDRSLPVSFEDWKQKAQEILEKHCFEHVEGGAGAGETLLANRKAFQNLFIRPRVLRDVSRCDTRISLFNQTLESPILLAPVGMQTVVHPEGELASSKAAAGLNVPFIASTVSSYSLEEIAETMGEAPRWFQLYWSNDRDISVSMIQRAERAGYSALVVTVDTVMFGWRTHDLKNAYSPLKQGKGIANYISDPVFRERLGKENDHEAAIRKLLENIIHPSLTWEDILFLRRHTKLPIILKGILHSEDARLALEYGIDGIVVSNHGGRQLDGAVATLDALPEIIRVIQGEIPVLLDGGIRYGSDIVKALALGAAAVLVGRPYVYALAVAGELGVRSVIKNLIEELDTTMALSGIRTLSEINDSWITRA